jgi:hypothetical protein
MAIMTKVKVQRIRPRRPSKLSKSRIRSQSGRLMDVFTVDVTKPTFEGDLTQLFKQNVAAARRENKRLFGSASGQQKRLTRAKPRLNVAREN